MADLVAARAHHVAIVAEAKDHLGLLAPDFRGQLARYLDLGEAPGRLLCAVLNNELGRIVAHGMAPDLADRADDVRRVISWLQNHAPPGCYGSAAQRFEWQERVAALVALPATDGENEPHDTEPPPIPDLEVAHAL